MQGLRFTALMLIAVSASLALGDLIELSARMHWEAPLWIAATAPSRGLFAPQLALELASAASALWLALRLRPRRTTADFAAAGALLLVAAQVVFWWRVAPAGTQVASWSPHDYPLGWETWRAQWECAQAVRALLQLGAFAMLLGSLLVEVPPVLARPLREGVRSVRGAPRGTPTRARVVGSRLHLRLTPGGRDRTRR